MSEVFSIDLNGKNTTERMKEITDRLEAGLKNLFDSEQYKSYLNTMSRFHNYSFNNTLLIAMQKPDASLVAGFHKWKKDLGRTVKKGEKAIKILAPAPYKKKILMTRIDPKTHQPVLGKDGAPVKEEKEITVPAFKVVPVFDVSQTEGRELPTIGVHELTGSVELYPLFFEAIRKTSPAPVDFEHIRTGARGYYHQAEHRIAINFGMSEMQNLKTLIHEIAHARLHAIDQDDPPENRPDRYTKEVQAESVAYTVCQHYGLDTSDYSFAYIAGWSEGKELPELKASLETIRTASHELISDIDRELETMQIDNEKLRDTAAQAEVPSIQAQLQAAKEKAAALAIPSPDDHLSGEIIQTPRGSFHLTTLTKEQMETAGYGVHHNSDDRKYHIMGNGIRAFAVRSTELLERTAPKKPVPTHCL